MTPITVVGIDGRPLSASARQGLAQATLVVGAARHLAAVDVPPSAQRHVLGELTAGIAAIRRHDGPVAVLASGDPGFFGIVRALRAEGLDVQVEPGVSSVSAAFALARLSWDDAVVASAHGRDLTRVVNICRAFPKVAVLTGPGCGPAQIAAALRGWPRRLVIVEQVGTSDQHLSECTPEQAAGRDWSDPNVVLSLMTTTNPLRGWLWPARQTPPAWGLPDDQFEHRDGMVTKAEVRAAAVAQLGPGAGDLVWDVGCGSGSIAVECARFGAAVVAIDRDRQQCERTARNAATHGVDVRCVSAAAPQCLAGLPDPDAVFVGGGGLATVAAAAARQPRAIVVALAAVDRVAPVRDALRGASYDVGAIQLSAARFCDLPDGTARLAGTNPVFLLWGHR
jgi:precorrin-6Y C5,15-methyltransferase (decarboxylating)